MTSSPITDALSLELDGYRSRLDAAIDKLGDVELDEAAVRSATKEAADTIRRFGNAADFCELPGLRTLASFYESNLRALADLASDERIEIVSTELIRNFSPTLSRFLRASGEVGALESLLDQASDERWPKPMEIALGDELRLTIVAECSDHDDHAPAGSRIGDGVVQPEDIELRFAPDINPQLAETFLLEAPQHTARFTNAIQRLAGHDASPEHVTNARRLAHTIKGSANITGVKGLANITHYVEDILERLAARTETPPEPLRDLLLETADCLEVMIESLAVGGESPGQAADILRGLAEWQTRLAESAGTGQWPRDRVREPEENQKPPAEGQSSQSPSPDASPSVPTEPTNTDGDSSSNVSQSTLQVAAAPEPSGSSIRVPTETVDNLIRLASEVAIGLVQMQGYERKALRRATAQSEHERLVQARLGTLQEVVNVRGVPASRAFAQEQNQSAPNPDFDPLELDEYNELHSTVNAFAESLTDYGEMLSGLQAELSDLGKLIDRQEALSKELNELSVAMRMVTVQTIVPRLSRSVRQTCRATGKFARLSIEGSDLMVDSDILNRIVDPLMHMLRNAIDHGIETPRARVETGKSEEGQVRLLFTREGDSIVIRCMDDGCGFDLQRVRNLALERGLIQPDEQLTPKELANITLLPGFSTRSDTTQISGRGIGMDVVYKNVQDMRGSLEIDTQWKVGTAITVRVPLTLVSMHVLLVRVRNQVYGVPSSMLEQAVYTDAGKLVETDSGWTFHFDGRSYRLLAIERLLGRGQRTITNLEESMAPLLLVRIGDLSVAILIDQAVDGRFLVVKRLGNNVPRARGVVGASILQDGAVAPILDLAELVREPARQISWGNSDALLAGTEDIAVSTVLVVDDSVSARRTLSELLQDAGYSVRTAVDGLDAIESIKQQLPSLVLLDLEMPNMNGLELTHHLRSEDATKNIPLIMITSRSTRKHHDQARAAGVDGVVTKPWIDDDLLEQVHNVMSLRGKSGPSFIGTASETTEDA